MTDEFDAGPARQPTVSKSADEAIERLTAQLNELVSVESVGVMVKTADLAALLLRAARVAELEARVAELEGALREVADDLEAEIKARAGNDLPRRVERDLEPVSRARALLKEGDQ